MKIYKGITYELTNTEELILSQAKEICNELIMNLSNHTEIIGNDFYNLLDSTYNGLDKILDFDSGEFSIESED